MEQVYEGLCPHADIGVKREDYSIAGRASSSRTKQIAGNGIEIKARLGFLSIRPASKPVDNLLGPPPLRWRKFKDDPATTAAIAASASIRCAIKISC